MRRRGRGGGEEGDGAVRLGSSCAVWRYKGLVLGNEFPHSRRGPAVLIFGFEAIFGWRDGASGGLKGEVYRAGSIRVVWPWGRPRGARQSVGDGGGPRWCRRIGW